MLTVAHEDEDAGTAMVPPLLCPDAAPDPVPADAPAPDETSDPIEARLREVLAAYARGETQGEIAARFGVTDRTIRTWLRLARERQLAAIRTVTAETVMAETGHRLAVVEAELLLAMDKAKSRGELRPLIEACRELRNVERDRLAFLDRLGVFDGFKFQPAAPSDPRVVQAETLKAIGHDVLARLAGLAIMDDPDD